MRLIRLLLVDEGAVLLRSAGNILWEAEPDLLLNTAEDGEQALVHLQSNGADLIIINPNLLSVPCHIFLENVKALYPSGRVILVHTWRKNPSAVDSLRLQAYRGLSRRLAECRQANTSPVEGFSRFSYNSAGLLILSDQIFQDLSASLKQLQRDISAAAVYLTDSNAFILGRADANLKLDPQLMRAALEQSLQRIYETGQLPGHGLESMHLAYRGIDRKNLYLFKVSGQLMLFLLVESGWADSYFESVWTSSFQAVAQLRHLLNGGFGKTAPFAGVDGRVSQTAAGEAEVGNLEADAPAVKQEKDKPSYKVLL
jgi:DNA-binding NarL/FixJ family response regulator